MKKTPFLFLLLSLAYTGFAQDETSASQTNVTVKWAPTGLMLGDVSIQAEYNFGGKSSLTAKIGLPVTANHSFTYQGKDADFNLKATSFLAGFRTYFGKKHMRGWYYEPFFKYVHHTSEGMSTGTLNGRSATFGFTNAYNGISVGVQLGSQFFIGKHFVVDLFLLGPEINSATNSFKATEVSSTIPWTYVDAEEAQKNIRDFLDQFPFIRNKTSVMVDKENKRVLADFSGILPGIRTGISFGFSF